MTDTLDHIRRISDEMTATHEQCQRLTNGLRSQVVDHQDLIRRLIQVTAKVEDLADHVLHETLNPGD